MAFLINVDGEKPGDDGEYYVTIHVDGCKHTRHDASHKCRYWIRDLASGKDVGEALLAAIANVESECGRHLRPRNCKDCDPGNLREFR